MAGKKVLFSIKNKIVLMLFFILVSVAGFNLVYSYITFKEDKINYIYGNSMRNNELATEKIQDYLRNKSEKLAKKVLVQNDEDFYLTGQLDISTKEFKFYVNDNAYQDDEARIKSIILKKSEKELKEDLIVEPLKGNLLIILKDNIGFRFALINQQSINEMLNKDSIFDYIVINSKKNLIYVEKNDKSLVHDFDNIVEPKVNQKSSPVLSNEKEYLASYTKLNKLDLIIFSYISYESAFAILQNIMVKNSSFTGMVLGIFMILSLFFSKKITTPILQLIAKTEDIANGDFEGVITVKTNDELKVLGNSVNTMSNQIMKLLDDKQAMIKELEVANAKLDEYNKNLEAIVAERTKELREANNFITAMINSLDQGLFVFDKTKKCLDIFTRACESMFKKNPKDLEVPTLLGLDNAGVEGFEKWSNVMFSNMMPFEAAKGLGPKNVVRSSYGEDDFQFISLDYYPMKDSEDQLENVVCVATDRTAEVEAEERFKEKDAYVSMILNIIKNKKAFYEFLDEMNQMLDKLSDFSQHEDLENIAMIVFHSMNGGFANYSISHLVKVARASETKIKSFIGNRAEFENLLVELIDEFKVERDQMLVEIESQLADSKNKFEIDKAELKELKERIADGEDAKQLYHEYFELEKVSSIFDPYAQLVEQISEKINKPMTPLLVIGGDLRIDTSKIKEFSSSLVHLFRNCMDHGIEETSKRVEIGKPEEGSITITCKKDDNNLLIGIQDDGAGINVTKIREVLDKKGIDHSNLSDKEAMMYIFKPDFSTAEKLTELSGRGVGMSAIDQAVKSMGGQLDLISQEGKGSKFIFAIPLN